MAQSEVDIANRALIRLGLQTISGTATSFSALIAAGDTKQSLALLNIHFKDWQRELLRSHPWNFAVKRTTLIRPVSLNPRKLTIRRFYAGDTAGDNPYSQDHANGKLNNPVVLDLRSKEHTDGPQGVAPSSSAVGFDHNIQDNDAIYLSGTPYTILNDKWYYVKRGWHDGNNSTTTHRTGGTLANSELYVSLYNKLGDQGGLANQTAGSVPVDASGDQHGFSVNGTALSVFGNSDYSVGTIRSEKKSRWEYAYQLPDDVIRLLDVEDLNSGEEFVVEKSTNSTTATIPQRSLLCNSGEKIHIKYVGDVDFSTSQDGVDSLFCEALSLKIAIKLSELLVKTASVTQLINQEYTMALSQAKSIDAQEGSPVMDYHSTWSDEMGRVV